MPIDKVYDVDNLKDSHLVCLGWVPRETQVLEFGPATGYLSRALRDRLGCTVTGFESSVSAAKDAIENCDKLVVGDIEDPSDWANLAPPYAVAIFLDVLEHLRDPLQAVIRCRQVLASDGLLIISVPNIAHWTIRRELLRGRFDYAERGILDNTHLKFFTRKTLLAMIAEGGFDLLDVQATHGLYPGDRFCGRLSLAWLKRRINTLMDRLFPDATAYQYLVLCRPHDADGQAARASGSTLKAGA